MFATFFKDGVSAYVFNGLLHNPDGKNNIGVIYDIILKKIEAIRFGFEKLCWFCIRWYDNNTR